jgi:hypothetical protein
MTVIEMMLVNGCYGEIYHQIVDLAELEIKKEEVIRTVLLLIEEIYHDEHAEEV